MSMSFRTLDKRFIKEECNISWKLFWNKVLSKPFILMQEFLNSAQKKESYSGLNIFKMAAMDAAIFEALWRHTAQIKYAKSNYKDFQEYFCYRFDICLILVTSNHFPQNKPNLWNDLPLKKIIFKICETALNIQNGGAPSTNVKIHNRP